MDKPRRGATERAGLASALAAAIALLAAVASRHGAIGDWLFFRYADCP